MSEVSTLTAPTEGRRQSDQSDKSAQSDQSMTEGRSDVWQVRLPNLRACFLPDDGYALVEADLARADAQVIAWEADATDLKAALRADVDIHSENADILFAHTWQNGRLRRVREIDVRALHVNGMSYRDCAKRWVHGTNFAGKARTLSSTLVLPEAHVAECQRWWCEDRHPQIGALHRRVEREIRERKNPVIYNRFGFRRVYVGGDRQSNLLGQALAFIAQSTVAIVINHALLACDSRLHEFELLLQIHDSILGQVSLTTLDSAFIARLRECMSVIVPYDDPLVIGSEIKWSARDWGHMKKWHDEAVAHKSQ